MSYTESEMAAERRMCSLETELAVLSSHEERNRNLLLFLITTSMTGLLSICGGLAYLLL